MPVPKYLYTCSLTGLEYWNVCGKIIGIKPKK